MKRVLVAIFVVCTATMGWPSAAATPHATWTRWLKLVPAGSDVGPNGTVVVAGSTTDSYPGGFLVLRGIRPNGTLAWASRWQPANGRARAGDVTVTSSGIYASGVLAPVTAPDACWEIGSFGWFVRKADASGHTVWVRSDPSWDDCGSRASHAVGAGAGLVAVATTLYIEGYTDIHGAIRAWGAGGSARWKNPFEPLPRGKPEGYDADDVLALAVGPDGTTYAAGWAWRAPYREYGNDAEAALMAIGPDGARRWVRIDGEPGRPSAQDDDRGSDVDARGRRVLYGAVIDRETGPSVARVMLLERDGTVRWTAGFPMAKGWRSGLLVALGPSGTAFAAYRAVGGDVVLRRLGHGGATTWRTTMHRAAPLVGLSHDDRGLYLLVGRHLTRFAE
jgi:hypothetical protein